MPTNRLSSSIYFIKQSIYANLLHRYNRTDSDIFNAGWDSVSKPRSSPIVTSQQGGAEDVDMESTQTQDDARDDVDCIAAVSTPQGDLDERYGVTLVWIIYLITFSCAMHEWRLLFGGTKC